jgi:hypothetical protein
MHAWAAKRLDVLTRWAYLMSVSARKGYVFASWKIGALRRTGLFPSDYSYRCDNPEVNGNLPLLQRGKMRIEMNLNSKLNHTRWRTTSAPCRKIIGWIDP